MAKITYLPIDPRVGFPQRFSCRIGGVLLIFIIHYNAEGDFYTATILDKDEDVIVHNKPFIYGSDLFDGVVDDRLPQVPIATADLAGKYDHAGKSSFMVEVFPWIMGR